MMSREFTDEEIAEMLAAAKFLNSFFQDGIVSWSIWTKEYMSEAENRMFNLIRIIDPTMPTREQIAKYWLNNKTEMLPPDPPITLTLPDKYFSDLNISNDTGGGGGVDE